MNRQVIVTTDSQTEIKPLIESVIQTELRMLELGLQRTARRLHSFGNAGSARLRRARVSPRARALPVVSAVVVCPEHMSESFEEQYQMTCFGNSPRNTQNTRNNPIFMVRDERQFMSDSEKWHRLQ